MKRHGLRVAVGIEVRLWGQRGGSAPLAAAAGVAVAVAVVVIGVVGCAEEGLSCQRGMRGLVVWVVLSPCRSNAIVLLLLLLVCVKRQGCLSPAHCRTLLFVLVFMAHKDSWLPAVLVHGCYFFFFVCVWM